MDSKVNSEYLDNLFDAVLTLKTSEECYDFFEDLCTINELKSLAQRLEVAKMLKAGNTYTLIGEKTRASTATISRVNRVLQNGKEGYGLVLERVEKESK